MMRNQHNGFKVSYEPEIFNGIVIRQENKSFPTALLFKTGSYQIMGGKISNVCPVNKFVQIYLKT